MKISVKIIACCLWIGFLIWFSNFGSPYFSDFVSFIKRKIFGHDISPSIDFAIAFIPWNIFISLLLLLPVLFIKRQRFETAREIAAGGIFFFILLAINIFSILIWCVLFPETIGEEPSFAALEQSAINDGWSPIEFRIVWWMFILISTAFGAAAPIFISQIKKQGILKTLSS